MKNIPALPDWFANVLLASNSNQNLRDGNDFMSPGIRNADLASVAGFLRRKFALGGDELEDALSALNNTAHQPLPSTEVSQIANSISRYHASPVTDFTDTGLSRVFAKQICDVFKFVEGMGWMNYREGHWQPDNENLAIQETAKEFVTRIHSYFEGCGTNDERKAAKGAKSRARIKAIYELAASDDAVRQKPEDFDSLPMSLNVRNGTIKWDTGEIVFHKHCAEDLHTKIANVDYVATAECPTFKRTLDRALDSETGEFLQRLFGYIASGEPTEQVVVFMHGVGANGKSTLINELQHLLGSYSCNVEPSSFTVQKNPGIRNDIARLRGARLALASEFNHGEIIDASLIKKISGGDPLTARFLHKEHFEFVVKATLVFVTNALPVLNGGDAAIARRVLSICFPNVIPPDERDPNLARLISGERSGVLNWLVEGLNSYLISGQLQVPDSVREASKQYMNNSDMLGQFLAEECEFNKGYQVAASEIFNVYKAWCWDRNLRPLASPSFKSELIKRRVGTHERKAKGIFWFGLKLKSSI
jgi:putative DNA primase/helicase